MIKTIVTTTISEPTQATLKFCEIAKRDDWHFVIVGDIKTPHSKYSELMKKFHGSVTYLHPAYQTQKWPTLSTLIGWNSIQRRNLGFIYACKNLNSEIIATVDDDNIPDNWWGKDMHIGETINAMEHLPYNGVFDPLYDLHPDFWHRGYPIQYLSKRVSRCKETPQKIKVMIQVNLWKGHPDIDAICRISHPEMWSIPYSIPAFFSKALSPFNSQNTILHRSLFPDYIVLPGIGRMDDIWPSYYLQAKHKIHPVYFYPTVSQVRHYHDIVDDLKKEMLGYENTYKLVEDLKNDGPDSIDQFIPMRTQAVWAEYRRLINT